MLSRFVFLLLLFFICFAVNVFAQSSVRTVNISSIINKKTVRSDKLKVEIRSGDRILSPQIVRGRFAVDLSDWPDEADNIALKITYNQYVLEFVDLTKDHFQGAWKVLVCKPDSPSEDIPNPDAVDYVYSIEFYSGNSVGTVLTKIKYKETK